VKEQLSDTGPPKDLFIRIYNFYLYPYFTTKPTGLEYNKQLMIIQRATRAECQWLMPVILATPEDIDSKLDWANSS
jgi:hypothetical protein